MHINVCYVINTVLLLHVSATLVAILRDALQRMDTLRDYKSLWINTIRSSNNKGFHLW